MSGARLETMHFTVEPNADHNECWNHHCQNTVETERGVGSYVKNQLNLTFYNAGTSVNQSWFITPLTYNTWLYGEHCLIEDE